MLCIDPHVSPDVRFVGIDNSAEMLERSQGKLTERGITREVDLQFGDLNQEIKIENASLVLTLQFVRTAVARLEFRLSTPTLAKTAVGPAKKAPNNAQMIQFMLMAQLNHYYSFAAASFSS